MTLYLGNNLISGVAYPTEPTRNLGQIIPSTIPLTDAGLHLLDGALINGTGIYSAFVDAIADLVTEYPDLFETEANWQSAVTAYGVCGKFVYDSVANTVRLPKITGIVEGTTDLTALGDLVEAGLPNITGEVKVTHESGLNTTGAFSSKYTSNYGYTARQSSGYGFTFDASRSSSIYGNSNIVQPQTIKVLYYIVIATTTKTEIEVDIDDIATDLNGKADVDLSNINASQTAKNTIIGWGIPDYTNGISQSLTTAYQSYTCPSDGIVVIGGSISNSWSNAALIINDIKVGYGFNNGSGTYNTCVNAEFIVGKGDVCKFKSQVAGGSFFFYPMKGVN